MNNDPVVVERTYNASVAIVWKALTVKEEMKQWYFDLKEFIPQVGFEFQFYGGKDDRQYLHHCRITEVIPESKIAYSWRYESYEGISYVTFDLFPEEDKTKVRVTHSGLETFPKDNPDLAKENFVEGWTSILDISLKEYVEKN